MREIKKIYKPEQFEILREEFLTHKDGLKQASIHQMRTGC